MADDIGTENSPTAAPRLQQNGHPQPAADQKHGGQDVDAGERSAKRIKVQDGSAAELGAAEVKRRERIPGVASIKEEYLIRSVHGQAGGGGNQDEVDDDAAEGRTAAAPDPRDARDARAGGGSGKRNKKQKQRGQNKERSFGKSQDTAPLCPSVAISPEFSPRACRFGQRCNQLHDLRRYLSEGRRGDLETLGGKCPVFEAHGRCPSGWRCRFVRSHMKEIEREDGRKELVLLEAVGSEAGKEGGEDAEEEDERSPGVVNIVPARKKYDMQRKRIKFDKSDEYIKWMNYDKATSKQHYDERLQQQRENQETNREDHRAHFVDPPFKPSEKRKVYFGRETPILAPLTTQGNLPFRRICVELGAQGTYSEMALAMDILSGKKSEWALMKAHASELTSPLYNAGSALQGYDNSRDLKFGAQIAVSVPWVATKATEALTHHLPHLRLIDLNCGCPIDLVFRTGAGSGLLDHSGKLERIIRSMNAVSGEVPITAKLRIGIKDGHPSAQRNIERLAFGGYDARDRLGAPGCAAITLHGRTRQQRYKRPADWSYIAECAALVKSYNRKKDDLTDTVREPDAATQANTADGSMYFLGNGDCYSHEDYLESVDKAGVDAVMVGRGALIKPWIFEEIEKGQHLDKSAAERLGYVEKFARYGMEVWGTDEMGLGTTRRFLLEYLSFAHRYVPLGILEHLPPRINDRPQAFRCRDDLETLLSSRNYRDWIKISELFLGPAQQGFKFEPKHKSNSYDIEAEG